MGSWVRKGVGWGGEEVPERTLRSENRMKISFTSTTLSPRLGRFPYANKPRIDAL